MPTPSNAPYKKLQRQRVPNILYTAHEATGVFKMRDGVKYRFKENKDMLGRVRRPSLVRERVKFSPADEETKRKFLKM